MDETENKLEEILTPVPVPPETAERLRVLIEADAKVTVREPADELLVQTHALRDQIEHQEIVAEAVHLGEFQTHERSPEGG